MQANTTLGLLQYILAPNNNCMARLVRRAGGFIAKDDYTNVYMSYMSQLYHVYGRFLVANAAVAGGMVWYGGIG